MFKYFLYARKSSEGEDRQVASIDSQISELKKLAVSEKLEIVDIIFESKSAKAPGRPNFGKMIERIHKGEANGILCWKLDRLARNPVDGGTISWMLQSNTIQHIRSFERNYYPTDNVLMMTVEFGVANQFIKDLTLNTARGMRSKAERGWFPYAQLPTGYSHNLKKGEDEVIINPANYYILGKVFHYILARKYSPLQIYYMAIDDWGLRNNKGGKISKSTYYRILSNPFYYGEFEFPMNSGNYLKGKHPVPLSLSEYNIIQGILGRNDKKIIQSHNFMFKTMFKCAECNSQICGEEHIKHQQNGNTHKYVYYRCTKKKNPNCSQVDYLKESEINNQLIKIFDCIEIPQEFVDWLITELRARNHEEFQSKERILEEHRKEYDNVLKKLERLADMKINGDLTEEIYQKKKAELNKQRNLHQEIVNDVNVNVDNWIDLAEKIFNFAVTAKSKFITGSIEEKKRLVSMLGSNLYVKDGKVSIQLIKPFEFIKSKSEEVKKIKSSLEPVNDMNKSNLFDAFGVASSTWGG
jgi:site-specific DNA recombinase